MVVVTAQLPDVVLVDGVEHLLLTNPFDAWMRANPGVLQFVSPHTACWRGYVARFELRGNELWLLRVDGWTIGAVAGRAGHDDPAGPGPGPVGPAAGPVVEVIVDHLAGDPLPARADWFDGSLRVASGPVVHYVHLGYHSRYEHEEEWTVRRGVVVQRAVLPRPDPDDDDPWR